MTFDEQIQENLRKSLKLVMVKVDPIFSSYTNFRNVNSYEGYVIEETVDQIRIMVAEPSLPIIAIPKISIVSDQVLTAFKHYLLNKINIDEKDALLGQIINSTTLKDIETFLKQAGYSDIDLIDMYREYIENV